MRLVNLQGADSVQHPEHGTAEAGDDGIFDVPDELGQALLAQRGLWRTEAEHIETTAQAEFNKLRQPGEAARVLHDLRNRVAELEAKLAGHEAAQPAEPDATPEPDQPEDTGKGKTKS